MEKRKEDGKRKKRRKNVAACMYSVLNTGTGTMVEIPTNEMGE